MTHNSPIEPLLEYVAQSPLRIAPERAASLMEVLDEVTLAFVDEPGCLFAAGLLTKRIRVSINAPSRRAAGVL